MSEAARSSIRFREPVVYNWRGKAFVQLQCMVISLTPFVLLHWFVMIPFYRWLRDRAIAQEMVVDRGTILLAAAAFCAVCLFWIVFFLPLTNGNGWLRKCFPAREGFFVQVRLSPRRVRGFMGWTEDADDVGVLQIEDGRLVFAGDASEMEILKDDIKWVSFHNVGWRAMWLWGNEARLSFKEPLEGIAEVALSSRQALTILGTRRFNRAIEERLQEFVD